MNVHSMKNAGLLVASASLFCPSPVAAHREGAGTLGLLGIMCIVFMVVALASAFVVSLRRPWMRIAIRVAGSWICASGLLMFGWMVKGRM